MYLKDLLGYITNAIDDINSDNKMSREKRNRIIFMYITHSYTPH